jgi:ATP-binding cassette subfamily F protein uup
MALVELIDIHKAYEAQKILCGCAFRIEEGERVTIIGKNGGGKSTLMKIVQGALEYDEGRRIVQNGVKIEMLSQTPTFPENLTVREAIENELVEIKEAKKEYETLNESLAKEPDNLELLSSLNRVINYLDHHNGWNIDEKVERVLNEFALKPFEHRAVCLLSGGEQRRVGLGALLLKKPDILLLDEPTNHLDVYMVEFLEELLLKESFTLMLISHDRYFIDRLSTRVVEVEECQLRSFQGGYSDYLHQKEELLASLKKSHDTLIKLLKNEEEWLSRGVKARLKRNEGRKARVYELREQAKKNPAVINKIKLQLEREKKAFNQTESKNRKKMLFELENITIQLGDKELVNDFSTRILQRDKIAIVGKNGSGKSTFLKLLLGELKQTGGSIKRGEFKIGYFDQHRDMLSDDKDLIETFCPNGGDRVDVRGKNMHVYGYLKNFLFPKEYLDKKIGVLSGGEKNRVALALLFTQNVDILILDEPTNDLDIPTINILEEYITNFDGAIIFVSHDRYFVDKIAKQLYIFGEGRVEISHRSYTEYLELEKELKELALYEQEHTKTTATKQKDRRQKKLSYKESREYEELPKEIEQLEHEVAELAQCLADPDCYEERGIVKVHEELTQKEQILEQKVDRFLEIEEKIESFNLKYNVDTTNLS